MYSNEIHPDALELATLLQPSWDEISNNIARSGVPTNDGTATVDSSLKDKLKRIESDLATARDERSPLAEARDDAKKAFAGTETHSPDSDEFKQAKDAVKALGEHDDKIANLQAAQIGTLQMLGQDPEIAARGRQNGGESDPIIKHGWSTANLASQDVREQLEKSAHSKAQIGRLHIGEAISRDALAASLGGTFGGDAMATDVTGTTDMRRGEYIGTIPQLRRQLSILDLISTGTMDQNTLPYTQESGALDGALETTEGSAKPQVNLTLTDQLAQAVTIAAYFKTQKQSISDYPALQTLMDTRLRYMVERRLEAEILSGDGSAPDLRGIRNTSGISTVTFDSGELPADQVLTGITNVLLANGYATGIVMSPQDWQTVLKAKATGDGHYFSGGPFSVTPQVMWGVPLIPSQAIPAGRVLVGDWQLGATLMIREGVQVLISDADGTDFTSNRVTLLGEMRAALPVWQPSVFCEVQTTA